MITMSWSLDMQGRRVCTWSPAVPVAAICTVHVLRVPAAPAPRIVAGGKVLAFCRTRHGGRAA